MYKTNRKIIGSYVAIHDGHTFTLNQIPNGSVVVIKFSSDRYYDTYISFETFILSKYTDDKICFSSLTNPISGRIFTINVNEENIRYNYNPENNDIKDINFGFDKKYVEIVAIYDRSITTLDSKTRANQYKLYGYKKYELKPIFLREFKYEYE